MKKTIILLIVLLCSLANAQFWENPNQKPSLFGMRINRGHPLGDPVGFWLMFENKGSQVYDLSGNGVHGTINQATWVAGPEGSALNLAGDPQRVDAVISQGIPLTIIVRCRPDLINETRVIIGLGTTGQYNTQFAIRMVSTGKWDTITFNDATVSKTCPETTASTAVGEWRTIAGVWYSTTDYRLYVDGIEYKAVADIGAIGSSTSLKIGSFSQPAGYFDGAVSYVYIYNRALNPSEIALLYREPFCMIEPSWNWILYGGISVPAGAPQVIFIN